MSRHFSGGLWRYNGLGASKGRWTGSLSEPWAFAFQISLQPVWHLSLSIFFGTGASEWNGIGLALSIPLCIIKPLGGAGTRVGLYRGRRYLFGGTNKKGAPELAWGVLANARVIDRVLWLVHR